MKKWAFIAPLILLITLLVSACSDQEGSTEIPGPIAMTEEAVGHYCNMNILEHTGPKAQIHLKNVQFPIWFSQVRDAVAFMRLPEETQEPVAIYVNDMAKAGGWDFPNDESWIDINSAFFVIESNKIGGMGAPEVIPFGTREAALKFTEKHDGQIMRLAEIPDSYVLGPVDLKPLERTTSGAIN